MILSKSNKRFQYWFIIVTILISINLWSFQLIPENIYNILEVVVSGILFFIVAYKHQVLRKDFIFKNAVWLFLFIPVLSSFGALIFHGQSLGLSLLILRFNLFWLFYFVLHAFNIPVEKLIKPIIFTGIVWAFLCTVQQFTYPRYYFYTRSESDTYTILRAGVYRFMASGQQYGAFALFYFFYQYLITRKINYLPYVGFILIGFYYYGTRQFAVSAAVCMCIALFIVRGRARLNAIIIIILGVSVLLSVKEVLFGQYIEMTNQQLSQEDDIRELSAHFWLYEYWPHWGAMITGNGRPHHLSAYGQEMEIIRDVFRYFRSDVGIIGAFNEFGIFYVLTILWVSFQGCRKKYYFYNNKYLQLVFYYGIILLILSQYFSKVTGIPFYCLVFYLVDKSYEEKKEAVALKSTPKYALHEDPSYSY